MQTQLSPKASIANQIFVRRSKKVLLETPQFATPQSATPHCATPLSSHYVASVAKNLEALGYGMSAELIDACRQLTLTELTELNANLIDTLSKGKGAHREFKPMYAGFPKQVMEMSEAELYLNALIHYLTDGTFLPDPRPRKLFGLAAPAPLIENTDLQIIDLGTLEEFESVFRRLASSNASLSQSDKEDLKSFVEIYGDDIARLVPDTIPQRESKSYIVALLIAITTFGDRFAEKFCSTGTDVLRVAVALSDGDVSLALPVKFKTFSRRQRRLLLAVLERQPNLIEDMLRWKSRWIRLGEKLHPGEFKRRYPQVAAAFDVLRNDLPAETFNGQLENALERHDLDKALSMLKSRPGDFARRLDHLLRLPGQGQDDIGFAFAEVASRVSTPVLLQVMHHFKTRLDKRPLRIFFPKGELAKAQAIPNEMPELTPMVCELVSGVCKKTLLERFALLPPLGNCFIDPNLKNYMVPFSQRSASKTLRTASRGSRMPLPDTDTLRFFIWWKNGSGRTDLDLSAAMFDKDFCFKGALTYYNLKDVGGCHSGDIVDAPNGASEFIDVSISRCLKIDVRYVVMALNSFTHQPYCNLPECFAGWMARSKPDSGEVYEPKTVQDKLDVSANTKIAIPAIFDIVERQVIWSDISLARRPLWNNNVAANLYGIQLSLKSLVELNKPNLYDLLHLHAEARGKIVADAKTATTIFSSADTPFDLAKIASAYMA